MALTEQQLLELALKRLMTQDATQLATREQQSKAASEQFAPALNFFRDRIANGAFLPGEEGQMIFGARDTARDNMLAASRQAGISASQRGIGANPFAQAAMNQDATMAGGKAMGDAYQRLMEFEANAKSGAANSQAQAAAAFAPFASVNPNEIGSYITGQGDSIRPLDGVGLGDLYGTKKKKNKLFDGGLF